MTEWKYETFAERTLNIGARSGAEWMVQCLFHDSSHTNMQFNVETGLFYCFKCHTGGNIRTIERKLGIRVEEAQLDVSDIRKRLAALKTEPVEDLPVRDESFLKQFAFPTRFWTETRGFEESVVKAFDLGYSPLGDKVGDFATIPLRNMNGGLLGVIKRYMDPDIPLRYRYPKGFKKSHHLFASWMVHEDDDAHTVFLTEGSIDAMKIWQAGHPAMAIYGSRISVEQVRMLKRLGIVKVVLAFDNDEGGHQAYRSCRGWVEKKRGNTSKWEYHEELDLRRDFLVEAVVWPKTRKYLNADPGGLSPKDLGLLLRTPRKVR